VAEQLIPVGLGDDTTIVVAAEQVGPVLVASSDVVGKLDKVADSIERVSREMLEAAKRAAPTKATVELGFTLALEQGQLVALFGKAKGEASVVVTLEWSNTSGESG
jgi:hypothetical protein